MEKDVRDKPGFVQTASSTNPAATSWSASAEASGRSDQLVGRVVRKLKDLDRLDNTLLVLTSDNGMTFGAHRILRRQEVALRQPGPLPRALAEDLGRDPTDVTERIQNIDLAPTLCDIAGCRLGPYPTGQAKPDGRSFLRLLTGERATLEREAVLTSYQDSERQMPSYWSVTTTAASPLARELCAQRRSGGCRWMYTEYETGETELYDLSNGPCHAWTRRMKGDPCMLENRAGGRRYADLQADLRRELARLRES